MIKDLTLVAQQRVERGKNEARRMRRAGRVPAVLYGQPGETEQLSVNPKEILGILKSATGENTIFQLQVGDAGPSVQVMIREYQLDPVAHSLLHADFVRIAADKLLRIEVPVEFVGDPPGVKEGGLLEHILRDAKIECLPADIPDHVVADLSSLGIGGILRAKELKVPERVKLLVEPEVVVATVAAPRKEEEAEAAAEVVAAEAPAEPEVVKKGKAATGPEEGVEKK